MGLFWWWENRSCQRCRTAVCHGASPTAHGAHGTQHCWQLSPHVGFKRGIVVVCVFWLSELLNGGIVYLHRLTWRLRRALRLEGLEVAQGHRVSD